MAVEILEAEGRKYALVAGLAYAVIIVCGLFAEFGVRARLYVLDSAEQTADNITSSMGLFRAGIVCDLVMLAADVVVAWALLQYFARYDRSLSLLAAFFRLVQAAVIAASVVSLFRVLKGVGPAEVGLATMSHADGYRIGLVFFGACCLVTGWLALKSYEAPKWISALLFLAGGGYIFDTFGRVLAPAYSNDLSNIVLLPAFVGEVSFCIWLIGWGGKARA